MQIDISQLRRNPVSKELELVEKFSPLNWQGEKLEFVKPVTINLTVERFEETYLVKGQLLTELKSKCNRCLTAIYLTVNTSFEGGFILTSKAMAQKQEEDFPGQFFSGDVIVLDDLIKESIYLALPMQFLCSPDCRGLCPRCGCNLNTDQCYCKVKQVDPRLEVLKKLIKD